MRFFDRFYLDREKDIVINLYTENEDELVYIIETPNHKTGNLITNLARICNLEITKNQNDMKIIQGKIPAFINCDNEEVYIFRLGGIKVANIYKNGDIFIKAKIPAINKILMSQTKEYKIPIEKTIIKTYISKRQKFRTDLHTHIYANLSSDDIIALGIKHQIEYPLYYIKKLGLKISDKQANELLIKRCAVENKYKHCDLPGKKLIRKMDDETCINFADLILNNPNDVEENISKIRNSLVLMKDGQAVFTNLEKIYLYRYVFLKGKTSEEKIEITKSKIEQIIDKDVKSTLLKMMEDSKSEEYKDNSLLKDKLLWVAREYQKMGIEYAEVSVTWIIRKGGAGAKILKELHEILPKIEAETGVKLRFLGSFSRTLMTEEQLKEGIDILKVAARSPYIVGSDIIGEEVNEIYKFKPLIKELVEYAVMQDDGFTIKIHAGENDSLRSNVKKSIQCIMESVPKGKKMPRCRLGHGLYGINTDSEEGQDLIKTMIKNGVILEFQLTSNVRLNNLTELSLHPIKKYLAHGVNCVQGSDGCGLYGTDCMEEQMALTNLLNLSDEDLMKMKEVETKLMNANDKYFKMKERKFEEWLNGRDIEKAILEEQQKEIEKNKDRTFKIGKDTDYDSELVFKDFIIKLPLNKVPVIIAGGSFNTLGRKTEASAEGINLIKELASKLNPDKAYFLIGHKMQGFEKAVLDVTKELNKQFEIDAIVPNKIDKKLSEEILDSELNGVCISIETEELGIYKSFNYEIFERIPSIVIAFDGNSPVLNLVQEAKNGKANARIYINEDVDALKEKASYLGGYITRFNINDKNFVNKVIDENPDIFIK